VGQSLAGDYAETFHWFRGEGFGLIIEDLLALPPDQAVIAEGFRLLPHLMKPLLHDPSRCVFLIPTPAFRFAAFESRGAVWTIPNKRSNPKRALSNLLERDRLFTERLRVTVETVGLAVVTVDGSMTEDELESRIAAATHQRWYLLEVSTLRLSAG
jgi:hypothetical protein